MKVYCSEMPLTMFDNPGTNLPRTATLVLLVCIASSLASPEGTGNCSLSADHRYGGIHVDCRNRNLTSVPVNLPSNTTYLDLSHNTISTIVSHALNLSALRYLDVSCNVIENLDSEAFIGVGKLQKLYLNDNQLQNPSSYPDRVFSPLKQLTTLHIHNNNLKRKYPDGAIRTLLSVEELKLDSFPETKFKRGFGQLFNLKRLLLGFQGCQMSSVHNVTFKIFENVTIATLDLQYCPISRLDINAFWYFHTLQRLVLSNAIPLTPKMAISAMYGLRGKCMKSIQINHIYQQMKIRIGTMDDIILGNSLIANLANICVEEFEMVNVKLTWIGVKLIDGNSTFASCIKFINLSGHQLFGDLKLLILAYRLPNLVSLNLQKHHDVSHVHDRMKEICTPSSFHVTIPIAQTLEYLNLQGMSNNLGCIYGLTFYNAVSLKWADFSYCGIEGFGGTIGGLERLLYLDLSGNNFAGMNSSFMASFPRLETFIMSNVQINENALVSNTSHVLIPLRYLTHVDFSMNNLKSLNPILFRSNPIEIADLSNNRFENIPFDLTTTPFLHDIDLGFNSLTVLSENERKLLDDLASKNNLTLNLEGNLLSCGCHNLDFIQWLYRTEVHIRYDVDNTCHLDNGSFISIEYVHEHMDNIWQQCNGPIWLSVSISIFTVVVLLMTGVYVIYRRKTLILNVTMRLFGIKNACQMLTRKHFQNDANIVYSDADYQYICHTVRDQLENRHGLKLFIKDRDTTPGRLISHEIIRGIDSSWRCILFLSKAFLEDNWCDFTMEYMVYVSSRRPSIRIVLVLCDDVMRGDISPSLLNVVEERHIYQLGAFRGDERHLWKEVGQCIKM